MIFNRKRKNAGFTGLELVVVVAVILILAGTMLAYLFPLITKARFARQEMELREFATAFARLYGDVAYLPPNSGAIDTDPGLWGFGTVGIANPINAVGDDATIPNSIESAWFGPYLLRSWPQSTPFGNIGNLLLDGYAYYYGVVPPVATATWDFDAMATANTACIYGLYTNDLEEVLRYVDDNLDDGNLDTGYYVYTTVADGTPGDFAFFIGEGPDWTP